MLLPANTSGFALASATVSGSSGQPGDSAANPAASKCSVQRSQLLPSSHSPWMKTTGVRPLAFAVVTCSVSCSVIGLTRGSLSGNRRVACERPHIIARVDRLDELQRVTDAALAYLSLDDLLQELLERISATLNSDTAAILLLDEDAGELVARAAKGIEEEVDQGVRMPLGTGFAGRIAAERHPIYLPDVEHADVLNPILREKGIRSLLGVPMLIEGQVIGVLHLGTLTPRVFTAEDVELLRMAADRAALAIDHARLFLSEREARQRAERVARQLAALQEVSDAALAYLPLEELLQELLLRISRILSSDTAAILMLDEPSKTLVARAARGIEEEVEQGVRIPLGKGFAGRIAAERRPIFLPDVEHA